MQIPFFVDKKLCRISAAWCIRSKTRCILSWKPEKTNFCWSALLRGFSAPSRCAQRCCSSFQPVVVIENEMFFPMLLVYLRSYRCIKSGLLKNLINDAFHMKFSPGNQLRMEVQMGLNQHSDFLMTDLFTLEIAPLVLDAKSNCTTWHFILNFFFLIFIIYCGKFILKF